MKQDPSSGEEVLNFPVFSGTVLPLSLKSLDEIDACIDHDYRHFFNSEAYLREKKRCEVHAAFSL